MAKVDKKARDNLEEAITALEDLGWKVTRYHVDGEPGVMRVDLDMVKYANGRIKTVDGEIDRD